MGSLGPGRVGLNSGLWTGLLLIRVAFDYDNGFKQAIISDSMVL